VVDRLRFTLISEGNMDGIYLITFRGAVDWGVGILLFRAGRIVGADASGVLYDGTYQNAHGKITIKAAMTVPPGATLVQGSPPRPQHYTIEFEAVLRDSALQDGAPVLIQMPPGPVNVIFKFLRAVED
jgi:hypothetical protein